MQSTVHISAAGLAAISEAVEHVAGRAHENLRGAPGHEHYRLLAFLSSLFPGQTIVDIGTHVGDSALALGCSNPTGVVHTFDICQKLDQATADVKWAGCAVKFHRQNLYDEATRADWRLALLASPLIVLDTDPHGGTDELQLYHWLHAHKYAGLLVCDDIWYFKGMRDAFWYHVPAAHKVDVTQWGHFSGTGIIHFGRTHVLCEPRVLPRPCAHPALRPDDLPAAAHGSAWTVVTAYFDLTKRADASAAICARPQSFYVSNAAMTMAIDQNVVLFCDASSKDALCALRPVHLRHKLHVVVRELGDFDIVRKWAPPLEASRAGTIAGDDRNTVSYYLFCVVRYVALQEAMAANVFGSTHFAWCNVDIERYTWKCGAALAGIWAERRDRFSTCFIDYWPRALVQSRQWFVREDGVRRGLCTLCSGFFTGNVAYMSRFCAALLRKFEECATAGLGHADEQLFMLVYLDSPELFDVYLGDYTEMVTSYGWVTDNPANPVQNIMRHLAEFGEDWTLLHVLCTRWLDSWTAGAMAPETSSSGLVGRVRELQALATRHIVLGAA